MKVCLAKKLRTISIKQRKPSHATTESTLFAANKDNGFKGGHLYTSPWRIYCTHCGMPKGTSQCLIRIWQSSAMNTSTPCIMRPYLLPPADPVSIMKFTSLLFTIVKIHSWCFIRVNHVPFNRDLTYHVWTVNSFKWLSYLLREAVANFTHGKFHSFMQWLAIKKLWWNFKVQKWAKFCLKDLFTNPVTYVDCYI